MIFIKYSFNQYYFDTIDNANKAYWLGFIWADGYVSKRQRKNYIEYNLKLSLAEIDKTHLIKFKKCLESNHPIHVYNNNTNTNSKEVRLNICNSHFAKTLYEKYKIQPYRTDISTLLTYLPNEFYIDFIRGVFDGDGSFTQYYYKTYKKSTVSFGGSENVLRFIENYISPSVIHKLYRRHKKRDNTWRSLNYSGIPQTSKILDILYQNATIYLDRKYQKYLQYKQQHQQ